MNKVPKPRFLTLSRSKFEKLVGDPDELIKQLRPYFKQKENYARVFVEYIMEHVALDFARRKECDPAVDEYYEIERLKYRIIKELPRGAPQPNN